MLWHHGADENSSGARQDREGFADQPGGNVTPFPRPPETEDGVPRLRFGLPATTNDFGADGEIARPVGICVFSSPAVSLAGRNRYFGLSGRWTRLGLTSISEQLVCLSRVVLDPVYRGAGIGVDFIRASCLAQPFPWVETLTEMGHLNPVFERAGFVRVDTPEREAGNRAKHSALWGTRSSLSGKKRLLKTESHEKSRWARPVYLVWRKEE